MELPFDPKKWYVLSAALQPPFRADLELTLELCSRVRYSDGRRPPTASHARLLVRPASTLDHSALSCLSAGVGVLLVGEQPSLHPAIKAKGSGRRG